MDPVTLASTAATLLAAVLTGAVEDGGRDLGQSAFGEVRLLCERLRDRLRRDRHGSSALERLEDQPQSEVRVAAVTDVLTEIIRTDKSFSDELLTHFQSIKDISPQTQLITGGIVSLQGNINFSGKYVAGRDLTIRPGEEE